MSRYLKSALQVFIAIVFMFGAFGTAPARPVEAASTKVVISEVYGGGGNSGATYTNDFIELFNLGATSVDLTGWSVQYASSTGSTWAKTDLSGTISAGGYFLVQEARGTGGTTPLPTPDATGNLAMAGSSGKVALVDDDALLIGVGSPTDTNVIDFVGYGSANVFEGIGPTAGLSNTTSASRTPLCFDGDDNKTEFLVGSPTPSNNSTAPNVCPEGAVYLRTVPASGAQGVLLDANITLNFTQEVTPTVPWYSLSCTLSGSHTAKARVEGATITLDSDVNFANHETCTLDVTGSQLSPTMSYNPKITFSTVEACGETYTAISAIQGTGSSTPFPNQIRSTEGVISANLQSTKQGFYIQAPTTEMDADPLTSEGLFIYTGSNSATLNVGDRVRVVGKVVEFSNLTEISPVTYVVNCGSSAEAFPLVELRLPFEDTNAMNLERYENMLVHFAQPLVINEYYNFDRYGEIVLSSKRLETPTNVVVPGSEAITLQALNDLDKVTLDDGVSSQNPDFLPHPNGGYYCQGDLLTTRPDLCPAENIFRGGDIVSNLTAVVDQGAGWWNFIKTMPATYAPINPRTLAPDLVTGELRISSINTLNYFITLDNTTTTPCGPLGNQDCRGAISEEERLRQRAKTVATVVGMASDITGLLELENDNPTTTVTLGEDYAIADIVAGLNDAAGAGTYAYIATGPIGTDAIKAGLVYKPARVTPVGDPAYLTSLIDPDFIDVCNRPVLAQTFRDNTTQELFTVAINHLKSKGSACDPTPDDPLTDPNPLDLDLGDGQSFSNYTRTQAAMAEVAWLETDPTRQGSQMYLIIGDLNSYAKEDPINAFKNSADGIADTADDTIDLVERFRGIFNYPPSYGYVYSAQAGYLDSALANRLMASYVLDAKKWHINADEVDAIDYTFEQYKKTPGQKDLYQADPYRSSDHDPILISLMLNKEPIPVDDVYTGFQYRTLSVGVAEGVLANDVDFNIYDNISASIHTQASNGVVVLQPDGSFTYTPNADFVGIDTFIYTMHADPGLMSAYENTATVTIAVLSKPFELYLPIIAK